MRLVPGPLDLRYAVRALLAGKLFTAAAITCLAIGIATNTTMFSVFDAIFLRPLPFANPDSLVRIDARHPETGRNVALTLADVRDLSAAVGSLESMAASAGRTSTLLDGGDPERIGARLVTANLFPLLGERPRHGRGFDASDDEISAPGVALISDSLWHRRYQADPTAIGRVIRLDGAPYTIVGVMPPGFRFPSTSELWIPIASASGSNDALSRSVAVVGRMRPDVTLSQLNAELAARALPARGSRGPRVAVARGYAGTGVGSEERLITGALMGAATLLVVLACVNVANLLLARGAGRRREMAVRASLGASRGRIVGQLLTESVLLALVAAAVALPLAWYGIVWVRHAVPPTEPMGPYYATWSLDLRTFAYAIAIALASGIGFGIAPAFDATGRRLLNPLREQSGAASSKRQRRVHSVLIVTEIALALILLAGASLFVRTYAGQRGIALGYDPSHLMTMRVYFGGAPYDTAEARAAAIDQIARRLETLAGAHAATVTDLVPLDDQGGSDGPVGIEGRTFEEGREPSVHYAGVAGRWPETFDVRVSAGRTFEQQELSGTAAVALVNQTAVDTFWPGQNPIGRRFRLVEDSRSPWFSVIGVVPDIRTVKLDERDSTPPTAYLPHRFVPARDYGIVIRTRAEPASIVPSVRGVVRAVDSELPLYDVYPMEQVRWLSYWMYILWGTLFGVFGIIALVMAAVGVFGVVYYTVAQRTREIGLRVALGARRTQVVGPMLRQVGLLAAIGLAIGLVGAVLITPVVASLLIGVSPNDPAGFAVASASLAAIALVATWFPAWRASAVDPVVALRDE